ncbi:MAG: M48 family metalloprotease [Candidatus Wolfebacteria bacterium]|nr:M48 family metalloprotease [Candidatus Wolfebacteria bacterium]
MFEEDDFNDEEWGEGRDGEYEDGNEYGEREGNGERVVLTETITPQVPIGVSPPKIEKLSPDERLKNIYHRIVEADEGSSALDLEIVDDIDGDRMNARVNLTTMMVTKDLINRFSDGELAAIVAHEYAHRKHKDQERAKEGIKEDVDRLGETFESLHAASRQAKEGRGIITRTLITTGTLVAGVALAVGGVVGVSVAHKARSRTFESEADLEAIELVAKAGFDPQEAVNMERKLSEGRNYPEGVWGNLMASHPDPDGRIQAVEEKVEKIKKRNRKKL